MSDKPRRSAGMRGHPLSAAPEHRAIPSTPPAKPRPEPSLPVRTSTSHFAKPKVLMGEVTMPRGAEIGIQREAFRAFMQAHRLTPSTWARSAGVPASEVLGFLTVGLAPSRPQAWKSWPAPPAAPSQDFFA